MAWWEWALALLWACSALGCALVCGRLAKERGGTATKGRVEGLLWGLLLGPIALPVAAARAGPNIICSYCETLLRPDDQTCPNCRAIFHGDPIDDGLREKWKSDFSQLRGLFRSLLKLARLAITILIVLIMLWVVLSVIRYMWIHPLL